MSKANDRQVAGTHYQRQAVQHWDLAASLRLDYFQGQITKYVSRWRDKMGLVDLEKGLHFLDKYLEETHGGEPWCRAAPLTELAFGQRQGHVGVVEYCERNQLDRSQRVVVELVCYWYTAPGLLQRAREELTSYLEEMRAAEPSSNGYVNQDAYIYRDPGSGSKA